MATSRIHALIPAAGTGSRFGTSLPKQYASLRGRPVISHSIKILKNHPSVSGVTVVLAADDKHYDSMVRPQFVDVATVAGGSSRAQSVLNGLQHILATDPLAHWVLVHDAARPGVQNHHISELVKTCDSHSDGAILAIQASDTIKRADEGQRITETLDRSTLWQAQTPQLFPVLKLAQALEKAINGSTPPTDEASAMEMMGARPKLVMGSRTNIKITGPEDLALVDALFENK